MGSLISSEIVAARLFETESRKSGTRPATAGQETFTIGDLARACGVTPRALRFYENKGLLAPQRQGALRVYNSADRDRLTLIAHGKRLGFTLAEIRDLIAAKRGGVDRNTFNLSREKCIEQINLLNRQKREIDAAISELREIYTSFYTARIARDASGA